MIEASFGVALAAPDLTRSLVNRTQAVDLADQRVPRLVEKAAQGISFRGRRKRVGHAAHRTPVTAALAQPLVSAPHRSVGSA
jgi:hypothetical protein